MKHNKAARAVEMLVGYLFGGSLLVYTANANLDLLKNTYPEPQFIGFGLFALEGGIVAWYLLHKLTGSDTHRGIAVFNLIICSLFSLIGFLVETLRITGNIGPIGIPPVSYVVVGAVAFNAIMAIIYKLAPYDMGYQSPQVRYEPPARFDRSAMLPTTDEIEAVEDQQEEKQPGAIHAFLAGALGGIVDQGRERIEEKKRGRPKKKLPPLVLPEAQAANQPISNTPQTPGN